MAHGLHNYHLAEILSGHPYIDRLSCEEKTLLDDMANNMFKLRNIMLTLKYRSVECLTT